MSWWRPRARPGDTDRPVVDPVRKAAWQSWRTEVFGPGYEVWHDGPNTHASTERWLAEREPTEHMIITGLELDDDATAVAVEDFAAAGHAPGPEVVAALVAATAEGRPRTVRVAALRAAWIVTRDPGFVGGLVTVLRDRRADKAARSSAAIALRDVPPTVEVADALAAAVGHDHEYLVRYHAASGLLQLAGEGDWRVGIPQPIVEIVSERGSGAARAALARDLRARVRTVA